MIDIYEGGCLSVMQALPASSIDMVLADLPYGTTYAPWDSQIDLDRLWAALLRVCKPNAPIILTASQPFTSILVASRPKLFRCEWIWDKVNGANFANANRQPLKVHENVLIFATGQPIYRPQKSQGAPNHRQGRNAKPRVCETQLISARGPDNLEGLKFPKSIQTFAKHSSQYKLHSTQKPVALFEYLIRTYSQIGSVVLDCTAGSGTTGEAAQNAERHAVLIDDNPQCIEIMRRRLPDAQYHPDMSAFW